MLKIYERRRDFWVVDNGIEIVRSRKPSVKWDEIWMEEARRWSRYTNCLSGRGVGAIVVDGYRFEISSGINGAPMGTPHLEQYHPEGKHECPRRYYGIASGEKSYACPCVHAEQNAIAIAARLGRGTENKTMYLFAEPGVLPCVTCAGLIIQAGINELVVDSFKSYYADPIAVDALKLLLDGKVLVRKPLHASFEFELEVGGCSCAKNDKMEE